MGCGAKVDKFEECGLLISEFAGLIEEMKEGNFQEIDIINFEQSSEKLKKKIKILLIQINQICDESKKESQIRRFLFFNEKFQNLCTEESNIKNIDLKEEQENKEILAIKNNINI